MAVEWNKLLVEGDVGISDNNIIEVDDADAADNDYAKFTANGLEGRSYSEVKTDLSLGMGGFTNEDDDSNAMVKSHAYLANQDGFVTLWSTANSAGNGIRGYIGDTDDPAGAGTIVAQAISPADNFSVFLSFPVQSGKYFETNGGTATTIIWHSMGGTLAKPTDQD